MINSVVIEGRLVRDPELKTTQSGACVCSFCVAVDRNYCSPGEERQTDFINVIAWRQKAEFVVKWFAKGDGIGVEGSIQTRKYTDKEGNKRTSVDVICKEVNFPAGSKKTQQSEPQAGYSEPQKPSDAVPNDFDDDLPF